MDEPLKHYAEHKKLQNNIYRLIPFTQPSGTGITHSWQKKEKKNNSRQVVASNGARE